MANSRSQDQDLYKMMKFMMIKEGEYERSEYDNMDMYDMFSKMYNSNKYDK